MDIEDFGLEKTVWRTGVLGLLVGDGPANVPWLHALVSADLALILHPTKTLH